MKVGQTALGLVLAGLAFAFFSIPVAGVDVLIDAAGFVLAFNGLRALALLAPGSGGLPAAPTGPSPAGARANPGTGRPRPTGPFAAAAWVALGLALPAVLQLFLTGVPLFIAARVRAVGEAVLFLLLLRGLAGLYRPRPAFVWAARVALCLNALASAAALLPAGALPAGLGVWALPLVRALVAALLLWGVLCYPS